MSALCQWDDKAPQDLDVDASATAANVVQARVLAVDLLKRMPDCRICSDELSRTATLLRQESRRTADPQAADELRFLAEEYATQGRAGCASPTPLRSHIQSDGAEPMADIFKSGRCRCTLLETWSGSPR